MEKLAVFRYAKALFEIAKEKNAVAEYNQAAKDILFALQQDKTIMRVISHPGMPRKDKINVINTAFAGKVPEDFAGLFALMLKRGRERDITGVLEHMDVLYKEYSRLAVAKLYSPEELPEEKVTEIRGLISKKLDKTIHIEKIIDKSLIAGFRVEVDGFVFDASTKNQVNRLKKELLGSFY